MDRRLVAAVVVLALVAVAGCERPPPQTEVVCDGCVTGVEETAPAVTVEESVTHVSIRETGEADVEARLQLSGRGVDELRVNETRRRQVAAAMRTRPPDRGEYSNLTRPAVPREGLAVTMAGETLLVTYRYPNFSDRRLAGTALSSRFYRLDGRRDDEFDPEEPIAVETDRLVVTGPEGTKPMVTPPNATDSGDRLVWTGGTIDPRSYLVFGSGGPLLGHLVVAADVYGWATWDSLFAAVLPALGLFVQAGLFAGYYPRRLDGDGWDPWSDRLFWALVGLEFVVLAVIAGWALANILVGLLAAVLTAGVVVVAYVAGSARADDDASDTRPADSGGPGRGVETAQPADRTGSESVGGPPPDTARERRDSTSESRGHAQQVEPRPREPREATGSREPPETARHVRYGWYVAGVAGPLLAVAALTAAVAVDYTASYSGFVAFVAALVPLVGFPALGYLVTTEHGASRLTTVTAMVTAPWVLAFALLVTDGATDPFTLLVVTFVWAPFVSAVGLLAFYAVLWLTTR